MIRGFYKSNINRYCSVDGVLKLFILICILLTSSSVMYAQEIEQANMVYPNPAKNEIYLKYNIGSDNSEVQVSLHDVGDSGNEVQLFKGEHRRGEYFEWYSIQSLKKGIYILKLKVGDEVKTERIVKE